MNQSMTEESVFKCFIYKRVLVVVISTLIGHLIDVLNDCLFSYFQTVHYRLRSRTSSVKLIDPICQVVKSYPNQHATSSKYFV